MINRTHTFSLYNACIKFSTSICLELYTFSIHADRIRNINNILLPMFYRYEGNCFELGQPNGPCGPVSQGGGIFEVNATTLQPECLKGVEPASLFTFPKRCSPGSKRDNNGNCRVVYTD